jgi:hypothetical protein
MRFLESSGIELIRRSMRCLDRGLARHRGHPAARASRRPLNSYYRKPA